MRWEENEKLLKAKDEKAKNESDHENENHENKKLLKIACEAPSPDESDEDASDARHEDDTPQTYGRRSNDAAA